MSKRITNPELPDNPDERFRELARSIAKDSIVTQATARLIEQVVQACHAHSAESIASLKEENEELVKALEWFANPENWREEQLSEGYVYSAEWKVGSCPIDLARAALSKARG